MVIKIRYCELHKKAVDRNTTCKYCKDKCISKERFDIQKNRGKITK